MIKPPVLGQDPCSVVSTPVLGWYSCSMIKPPVLVQDPCSVVRIPALYSCSMIKNCVLGYHSCIVVSNHVVRSNNDNLNEVSCDFP